MYFRLQILRITGLLLLAVAACDDQTGPDGSSAALSVVAVSPQPDTAIIGLPRVLQVRVVDRRGNGVAGVAVSWHAADSADIIDTPLDTTDGSGLSSTTLRVKAIEGVRAVVATLENAASETLLVRVRGASEVRFGLSHRQLDLISRQSVQLAATPATATGNALNVPIRWGSSDGNIATVDSTGLVRARRPGTAIIYVSATVAPFSVDSVIVNVRFAIPAGLDVSPQPANLLVGHTQVFRAIAFDSAGRPIDARDIEWSFTTPATSTWFSQLFEDSSKIYMTASAAGSGAIMARVRELSHVMPVNVIPDPVVESLPMVTSSFCYSPLTFGPSGQWYYVSNIGGSRLPGDTIAVVRTGNARASTWTASESFTECDRTFSASPLKTISVDASENLYLPTKRGVLSISGVDGRTRWHAPIGSALGNVALSASGLVIAGQLNRVVALNAATGDSVWSASFAVVNSRGVAPYVDEARGVVYAGTGSHVYALDLHTGRLIWQVAVPNSIGASLAIAATGQLYIGGEGVLRVITVDGAIRSTSVVLGSVSGSPLIDAGGRIFVATTGRRIYSFTNALEELWSYEVVPRQVGSTSGVDAPVLDREGTVYFGAASELFAVREGRLLWSRWDVSTGWGFYWLIGPDGDLYASTHFGAHRVRTAGRDTNAQWPMPHHTPDRAARR